MPSAALLAWDSSHTAVTRPLHGRHTDVTRSLHDRCTAVTCPPPDRDREEEADPPPQAKPQPEPLQGDPLQRESITDESGQWPSTRTSEPSSTRLTSRLPMGLPSARDCPPSERAPAALRGATASANEGSWSLVTGWARGDAPAAAPLPAPACRAASGRVSNGPGGANEAGGGAGGVATPAAAWPTIVGGDFGGDLGANGDGEEVSGLPLHDRYTAVTW